MPYEDFTFQDDDDDGDSPGDLLGQIEDRVMERMLTRDSTTPPGPALLRREADADPDDPDDPLTRALGRNPYLRPGEELARAEYLRRLTWQERETLDEMEPGWLSRMERAHEHEAGRAKRAGQVEAQRAGEEYEASLETNGAKLQAHFDNQARADFTKRYWQMAPDERITEAKRLGIPATFIPPSRVFG